MVGQRLDRCHIQGAESNLGCAFCSAYKSNLGRDVSDGGMAFNGRTWFKAFSKILVFSLYDRKRTLRHREIQGRQMGKELASLVVL